MFQHLDAPVSHNGLVAALPNSELREVLRHARRISVYPGQFLIETGRRTDHIFFLESGVTSLVTDPRAGVPSVQIAMIGRESAVGSEAMLMPGAPAAATALVWCAGTALRLPVAALPALTQGCPFFHALCAASLATLLAQTTETIASSVGDTLVQRCARWLLMAHDRVDGDTLPVAQTVIANFLGARRPRLSLAINTLEEAGLVKAERTRITIRNRAGLMHVTGEAG